jgi:hypothetical protein
LDGKEIGRLEWELDEAAAQDRRQAPHTDPDRLPDTAGENLGAIMRAMSTGRVA